VSWTEPSAAARTSTSAAVAGGLSAWGFRRDPVALPVGLGRPPAAGRGAARHRMSRSSPGSLLRPVRRRRPSACSWRAGSGGPSWRPPRRIEDGRVRRPGARSAADFSEARTGFAGRANGFLPRGSPRRVAHDYEDFRRAWRRRKSGSPWHGSGLKNPASVLHAKRPPRGGPFDIPDWMRRSAQLCGEVGLGGCQHGGALLRAAIGEEAESDKASDQHGPGRR
jgi:hypothetical protein